jgi:hypothetical protein
MLIRPDQIHGTPTKTHIKYTNRLHKVHLGKTTLLRNHVIHYVIAKTHQEVRQIAESLTAHVPHMHDVEIHMHAKFSQ